MVHNGLTSTVAATIPPQAKWRQPHVELQAFEVPGRLKAEVGWSTEHIVGTPGDCQLRLVVVGWQLENYQVDGMTSLLSGLLTNNWLVFSTTPKNISQYG